MNPLTQSLPILIKSFAIASVVGALSYGFIKWIRKVCPNSSGEVLCIVVGFPHIGLVLLLFALTFYWPFLILGALVCSGSALAEKAVSRDSRSYGFHYSTVLLATALSFNLSAVTVILEISESVYGVVPELLGLISGSSAIPILLWMFQTSKLRPGIDRHLNSDDEPM